MSAALYSLAKLIYKRAHKYGFSNKICSFEEIAKEADETLFLKMKGKQHCLNPTLPPLKPNTHGLCPRGHSYELSFLNVRFNSAKIHALSGVYTDTYDDDAVLHFFLFLFSIIVLITLCAKLSGTVYCYRSCLCVFVMGGRALFVCASVTTIT